jgi:hypothetical protein
MAALHDVASNPVRASNADARALPRILAQGEKHFQALRQKECLPDDCTGAMALRDVVANAIHCGPPTVKAFSIIHPLAENP